MEVRIAKTTADALLIEGRAQTVNHKIIKSIHLDYTIIEVDADGLFSILEQVPVSFIFNPLPEDFDSNGVTPWLLVGDDEFESD